MLTMKKSLETQKLSEKSICITAATESEKQDKS